MYKAGLDTGVGSVNRYVRPGSDICEAQGSKQDLCDETSASSRTIATWVSRLITSEEGVLKETLALREIRE